MFFVNLYALTVGKPAPNFKLMGHDGKTYELNELKDKVVVLEWYNSGCPYVRKHYDSMNMQNTQKKYGKDVLWLSVVSSAVGKQGHLENNEKAMEQLKKEKSFAKALLRDQDGSVGKMYSAKTTPHMFIINKGTLAYQGAIDSIPSANPDDVSKAKNYVSMALDEIKNNKPVKMAKTNPYGCSVKY